MDLPTGTVRERGAPRAALDTLLAFRAAVYAAFGRRADALFELLEALAGAGAVASPIHLSLEAVHRRGWGSFYAALNHGEVPAEAVEALLAQHPLAEAAGGPPIFGVDTSVWPRCDAETSPERGFYHHSSRHSAGKPIVAGWSFQWVAQLSLTRDSWTAPLSVRRVPPGTEVNAAAALQIEALLARLPADGPVPLFAFDCGYDSVQLGESLAGVRVAIVVRLREGRCFYADPPPPATATGKPRTGRPRRHGAKFACAKPATWWAPDAEHTEDDPQYGRVRVRAWPGVHAQVQNHPTRGTRGPRPLQRATPPPAGHAPSSGAPSCWWRSSGCPTRRGPPSRCGCGGTARRGRARTSRWCGGRTSTGSIWNTRCDSANRAWTGRPCGCASPPRPSAGPGWWSSPTPSCGSPGRSSPTSGCPGSAHGPRGS